MNSQLLNVLLGGTEEYDFLNEKPEKINLWAQVWKKFMFELEHLNLSNLFSIKIRIHLCFVRLGWIFWVYLLVNLDICLSRKWKERLHCCPVVTEYNILLCWAVSIYAFPNHFHETQSSLSLDSSDCSCVLHVSTGGTHFPSPSAGVKYAQILADNLLVI